MEYNEDILGLNLVLENKLLGTVALRGMDHPHLIFDFVAAAAFEDYRGLFEQESELLDRGDIDAWIEVNRQIEALDLKLLNSDGDSFAPEFTIRIHGDEALIRY